MNSVHAHPSMMNRPPQEPLGHARGETDDAGVQVLDMPIGRLLRHAMMLTDEQVERVLKYQREHRLRFGEAAVALKLATDDDVVWALSQQFHYPYALGSSALHPELVAATSPFSDEAEGFRELRAQLLMGVLAPGEARRAVAVVSPDVGDGKTYLAANTAVAFSQLGGRTLLLDADMRTPRLQTMFGIAPGVSGLSSILVGRAETNVIRPVRDLPSLYVLPVGESPPNPQELVQRPAFSLLVKELLTKFDHVVVDTPAASHGADARVIAAVCGAAVMVGRQGRSRMDAMGALLKGLSKSPCKLAGVVMNEY
ncbi:MAG: polysaccharide biosynthesis tyrosine autokinase [Vitreoscilla sp.]